MQVKISLIIYLTIIGIRTWCYCRSQISFVRIFKWWMIFSRMYFSIELQNSNYCASDRRSMTVIELHYFKLRAFYTVIWQSTWLHSQVKVIEVKFRSNEGSQDYCKFSDADGIVTRDPDSWAYFKVKFKFIMKVN